MFNKYFFTLLLGILLLIAISHLNKFSLLTETYAQTSFRTYTNTQGNFSAFLPSNWLILENKNFSANDTDIATFNSPDKMLHITVSLEKGVGTDSDLSSVVNDTISNYKTGQDLLQNFNLLNKTDLVDAQNKVNTTNITYTYDEDGQKYKDIETYFMHKNDLFTITYENSPDHFNNGISIYHKIVSSFLVK